jgi:hypothetical protein
VSDLDELGAAAAAAAAAAAVTFFFNTLQIPNPLMCFARARAPAQI